MNRKIKFRAWDTVTKKYEDWNDIQRSGQFMQNYFHGSSYGGCTTVLQQFTGLKDKNGKEIYEGDIVKLSNYYDQTFFLGSVYFDNYLLSYVIGYDHDKCYLTTFKLEIIGNIFENPELLTVIQKDSPDNSQN